MSSVKQSHSDDKTNAKLRPQFPIGNLQTAPPQPASLTSIVQRAQQNPQSLTPSDVQQLQRTVGNEIVGRFLTQPSTKQLNQTQNPIAHVRETLNQDQLVSRQDIEGAYGKYDQGQINDLNDDIHSWVNAMNDEGAEMPEYIPTAGAKYLAHADSQDQNPGGSVTRGSEDKPKYLQDREGWKLHIGVKPDQAKRLLELILPKLQADGVFHKFINQLQDYVTDSPDHKEGLAKYITIYPDNLAQLIQLAQEIQDITKAGNFTPLGEGEWSTDMQLGNTGMLSTRYGSFTGKKITDPLGDKTIPDNRSRAFPPGKENEAAQVSQAHFQMSVGHIAQEIINRGNQARRRRGYGD